MKILGLYPGSRFSNSLDPVPDSARCLNSDPKHNLLVEDQDMRLGEKLRIRILLRASQIVTWKWANKLGKSISSTNFFFFLLALTLSLLRWWWGIQASLQQEKENFH
jgi:hypothetical protein